MQTPELPSNENERLKRLRDLGLLDTAAEDVLDAFTRLACGITGMPIALISLVDAERQWLKSAVGLPQGMQTARSVSFCGHAIREPDVFEVEDARVDSRFADNPLVTGEPGVVHYAGAPLVMPGGEAIGTVCVISPQSGRLEARERRLLMDLADSIVKVLLVRERERRSDREAQAALHAADQASQAKSDFLATMSHEIRTPLNGVIGLTQLLAVADLPPMEKDCVGMIDSCAKSLLSLVDNILDFSKIEAGRLALEAVPMDLAQLVQEVCDVFSVRSCEKGLRFDLRYEPDVPRWISADPGRLRQILLNLLGNALKFTSEGGFSLHVSVQQAPGGAELRFAVFDTGIGISEADQAKLFVRFTQADASFSRRHSGTGLGLAISRQLAQLMGGDVALASRAGHGSTFTLQMPLRAAPAPIAPAAVAAAAVVRRDARILLAEDNEVNQLVAQRLLASLGYQNVTAVFTGREAVDACARTTFDLVLMDCQMPAMDGWEATRQLRDLGVDVPIIAFTASATSVDRERCLQAGMNDYLTKPVERAVLADKLQRWVTGTAEATSGDPQAGVAVQPETFRREVLESHFLGDLELFAQARELFVRQTRPSLADLQAAGSAVDVSAAQKVMHRIRGSAATLGAQRLAECCRRVEETPDASPEQVCALLREAGCAFEAFISRSEGDLSLALAGLAPEPRDA